MKLITCIVTDLTKAAQITPHVLSNEEHRYSIVHCPKIIWISAQKTKEVIRERQGFYIAKIQIILGTVYASANYASKSYVAIRAYNTQWFFSM